MSDGCLEWLVFYYEDIDASRNIMRMGHGEGGINLAMVFGENRLNSEKVAKWIDKRYKAERDVSEYLYSFTLANWGKKEKSGPKSI